MKPDTASRLLYQEAALRSFLRSDSIAQSFIQNTPNYNMEDLQQLYFASASIKSKKMLIEFVKISTKQLCLSLRDRLPLFRYLNPDNISTDLTDDELMLLIHEASHSMSLDQQIGSHGNIAFLVAKNIIFNLVGVNATATLNSFLKTPDLGSFTFANKTVDSDSPFKSTGPFSTPSSSFPMPPPPQATFSSQFPMHQTATSLPLTLASTPPPPASSPYMPPYGSSPTIISTSVANLSFVSMNSSMPPNSNSFMTVSTSTPHTPAYSVTPSGPTPAVADKPHNVHYVEPDFDTGSHASESSETRFEVIGENEENDDDDNSRNIFNQVPTADYPANKIDTVYDRDDDDDDDMSVESTHDNIELETFENSEADKDDDERELDDDSDNYQRINGYPTTYDDLYEQDQRTFEQEMIQNNEIKRVFSASKFDDEYTNVPVTKEMNDPYYKTPPSTPPPPPPEPFVESPRKFPLRKKPRKRKASRYIDDNEEVVNKQVELQNKPWLEPEIDFKPSDESGPDRSFDAIDGRMITNINQVIERSQSKEKKLFADESVFDLMNDLKHKGVLNIPTSPRNITFSNIDT